MTAVNQNITGPRRQPDSYWCFQSLLSNAYSVYSLLLFSSKVTMFWDFGSVCSVLKLQSFRPNLVSNREVYRPIAVLFSWDSGRLQCIDVMAI